MLNIFSCSLVELIIFHIETRCSTTIFLHETKIIEICWEKTGATIKWTNEPTNEWAEKEKSEINLVENRLHSIMFSRIRLSFCGEQERKNTASVIRWVSQTESVVVFEFIFLLLFQLNCVFLDFHQCQWRTKSWLYAPFITAKRFLLLLLSLSSFYQLATFSLLTTFSV